MVPRSPDLRACDCYLWGNPKTVMYANNSHDLEALKRNIVIQFTTLGNVNSNKFPRICLKKFTHVSQQKVHILVIFYDFEYTISYCILLKLKKEMSSVC
jgi:hypothetical protein